MMKANYSGETYRAAAAILIPRGGARRMMGSNFPFVEDEGAWIGVKVWIGKEEITQLIQEGKATL